MAILPSLQVGTYYIISLTFISSCGYILYRVTFKFIFKSKLALKSWLWTHHSSVCRVKTQTIQKVRLHLNIWSVICNPWCIHNLLFNGNFEDKFKWTPDIFVKSSLYSVLYSGFTVFEICISPRPLKWTH
jgi:hypothetical protein